MKFIRLILLPFSLVYSTILWLRNKLFDKGILFSSVGEVPTIVVGNLSLGGSGKTPHTAQILSHLQSQNVPVAMLSRGYGRSTKGFVTISNASKTSEVGDEPLLLKHRFPSIPMAVCEDRLTGIKELCRLHPELKWVILDDAFQHRRLKGNINILLTEAKKPFNKDFVLPAGALRDHPNQVNRANVLVVTKFDKPISVENITLWKSSNNFNYRKPTYFSNIIYNHPIGLFDGKSLDFQPEEVMGITGIAQPQVFEDYLKTHFNLKKFKSYPDHHPFSVNDLTVIQSEFDTFTRPLKALLVTEKDAVKLREIKEFSQFPIFYIPIEIHVANEIESNWLEEISSMMKAFEK